MTAPNGLRAIPTDDRAWLMAALADALRGGAPVLPLGPESAAGPGAAQGAGSGDAASGKAAGAAGSPATALTGSPARAKHAAAPIPDPDSASDPVSALQREPLPEGTAVVVRTSGSSGVPKAVALSAAALRASAEATHERFGGPGQWLVALPVHLVSGLQMLVRSEVSGIPPVFFDGGAGSRAAGDRVGTAAASGAGATGTGTGTTGSTAEHEGATGGFDPARLLEIAETLSHERRYVSLVPVQFSRLLDLAERDADAADALRRFDAVLVGGQAVPLAMRRRAHELGVALKRSYGMTETAGGCVYDGVEIGDVRVRIRDGEVQLAGPSLALGYVGDPELTEQRFIEETGRDGAQTRWYRTGDAGELLGGMLTVTGRLDRVIISGGVNVSLDEVERVVRDVPGWSSAVAVATPHPEWGERVSLVVETEEGAAAFDEVRSAVRDRLGPAAAPVWATETERIPRLAGGKPDLAALGEWLSRLRASFAEVGALRGAEAGTGGDARCAAADAAEGPAAESAVADGAAGGSAAENGTGEAGTAETRAPETSTLEARTLETSTDALETSTDALEADAEEPR
ncbi:MAG: AMP-binding protein [Leucobacter sp.]